MRVAVLASLLGSLAFVSSCPAQSGVRVVKLRVAPAAPSALALKYPLLPKVRDLRTGNAAVFYQRSHSPEWLYFLRQPEYRNLDEWLERPMDAKLLAKLKFLADHGALKVLDEGARCDYCSWQMLERVRREGFMMLIPDMQAMRTMSMLLSLRARLEIHQGKTEQAIHTLQTGFAMSRHVGEALTAINYLIGVAVAHNTLERVEELIQQPQAPNLYWSLTDLPSPLIDMRRPVQSEQLMIDSLFPEVRAALNEPEPSPVPTATLRRRLAKLSALGIAEPNVSNALLIALAYPEARRYFREHGRTEAQLEALPITQVVLMYQLAEYDRWMDEYARLQGLPYWQAAPRLREMRKRRDQSNAAERHLLLVRQLLPALDGIYLARARLERRIALLRCVEALRLHAAAHDGALPETLAELREVPVPVDPLTGKAFRYRRNGATASLESDAPAGASASLAVRYEIAIRLTNPKR